MNIENQDSAELDSGEGFEILKQILDDPYKVDDLASKLRRVLTHMLGRIHQLTNFNENANSLNLEAARLNIAKAENTESLEAELERVRKDYIEVEDELRVCEEGKEELKAAGAELEDRLEKEEAANQSLRSELEQANLKMVVLCVQRERDANYVKALERELAAASLQRDQAREVAAARHCPLKQ